MGLKLNLGCGSHKLDGHLNVDFSEVGDPDLVLDLETTPWPWDDGSVEAIVLRHVLEHLGQAPRVYLAIWQEMYRVCRDGAVVTVTVPHPRHDHYVNDPTHVRPITAGGLALFSQKLNREALAKGFGNTPLALDLGIDFEMTSSSMVPDQTYREALVAGTMTQAQFNDAARMFNNVISETTFVMTAIKPAGRTADGA